jgi:putative membrane protein
MNTTPLLNFLLYFALALAGWSLAIAVYVRITPYREFELVRQGNLAAACSLSGTALGLAFPLASLVLHAVGVVDFLVWTGIALTAQLGLWAAFRGLLFRNLGQAIPAGQTSVGLVLGAFSLGLGVLNAACLSY